MDPGFLYHWKAKRQPPKGVSTSLPPSNKDCEGYVFTHVCLSTGGCYPSMHCRWHPSMPCSRSRGGGVSQHALQVFRPTHPGGKLRGIWPGGSPGPHPGGFPGPHLGGNCSRGWGLCSGGGVPAPRENVENLAWRLLLWAVCILLECILVFWNYSLKTPWNVRKLRPGAGKDDPLDLPMFKNSQTNGSFTLREKDLITDLVSNPIPVVGS